MRKQYYIVIVSLILLLMASCKTGKEHQEDNLPYNPYVEGFTTGNVSRFTPIRLVFNEDVPAGQKSPEQIARRVKIKPAVEGEFLFEDDRTLVFKPSEPLRRNTSYEVSADLSSWFKVNPQDRLFTFRMSTVPFEMRATLQSLRLNEENQDQWDVVVDIFTLDREPDELVESLVETAFPGAMWSWNHSSNGKKHTLSLGNIKYDDKNNPLEIKIKKNKENIPVSTLLNVAIPSSTEFTMYDVRMVNETETYIEASFTQALDPKQDLTGLVYLEGGVSKVSDEEVVSIDGNIVRIYPAAARKGTFRLHISREVKSNVGAKLKETFISTLTISEDLPGIEFIGKGVIMPQSSELIVPFRAVHMRGVIVRVVRVIENNIGQFLQTNQLDGSRQLKRVGRLVCRKTIFLEDDDVNLSEWNTFAIDLRELMEPEPGAIYRIELDINKDLSIYPCEDDTPKTKEELLADDARLFDQEVSYYDQIPYYYYGSDYDDYWYDYDYDKRKDPCSTSYYYRKSIARNVLSTNLGIIAKRGDKNEMLVIVNNILTTYSERGVDITIYNYQNQVIGSGVTDQYGQARIKMASGRPFFIMAKQGKQKSYLRIDDGSSLSTSNFDVSGEVIQKGIKGFIYGDRGVWRPGDTMYLSFMLNDRDKTLPDNHPVVMELYNPNGQLYLRKTSARGELGVYSFAMPTDPDAPTGAWNVQVKVGGVTFYKRVRVESIKPNRLKISLTHPDNIIVRNESYRSKLHVEWLQGATARNLKYEIEGTFTPVTTSFPKFKGFHFDTPVRTFNTESVELVKGKTDDKGDAEVPFKFDLGATASGMLSVSLFTRVYEESGDFSIDGEQLLYSPYTSYAGVKVPEQSNSWHLHTGKKYTYDVAAVSYKGEPLANHTLEVNIYKVERYWWWNSSSKQLANYIQNSHNKPVNTYAVETNANGRATFDMRVNKEDWGTYYIEVRNRDSKHTAGILSYYDWPDSDRRRDGEDSSTSATSLSIKTDKETYEPGEKIRLTIPSSNSSRALVSIETATKVLSVTEHYCTAGETVVEVVATEEMRPNAYAHVTLLQPHAYTENDLPIRMYGIALLNVNSAASHLNPVLSTPAEIKPEQNYEITVSEQDGREMAYTIAIVDEGLLDLTRFKTPDPWSAFNAREALGVTTWDLYNNIVGAYGGRIEQIFSIGGDDDLNAGPKAVVNRFKPVVQFDGPFLLKKGEKKRHQYMMPNYNGRVRMMIVAGDGSAYGHTEKSVMVRKPVMLLGTLPRVIGIGEEMDVPATVFATEENVGKVKVTIQCSDNMEVIGEKTKELNFTRKEDKQATFRIRVKNTPGVGQVKLAASRKGDNSTWETDIEVRSVRRAQVRSRQVVVQPGQTFKENLELPGAAGTNSLAVEIADIVPVGLSTRLSYLIGYPHGCLEQVTSKAFPQLYLDRFTKLTMEQERTIEQAVKDAILRVRSYQMPSGAFSYWPGGSDSNGWASVYVTHFLLEAEANGYTVPENIKKNSISNLRKLARAWNPSSGYKARSEEMIQAYRLYVLSLAQSSEVGAMNRLREQSKEYAMTRWILASAYALIGREDVANELIKATVPLDSYKEKGYDYTFGSSLRDNAMRLQTLSLLKKTEEAFPLMEEIAKRLSGDSWLSTQETAYSLLAISEFIGRYSTADRMQFTSTAGSRKETINSDAHIWSTGTVKTGKTTETVEVNNTGKSTLFVQLITEGTPDQGEEEAYAKDVSVEVKYLEGNRVATVEDLQQGTNFTAVVTVKNTSSRPHQNLVLTQVFPSGWEILNTRFLEGGSEKTDTGISYQDIRDDRVYSYIDHLPANRQVTVRINLCAVYPGHFYLPPVWCEAMYDNQIRANTKGRQVVVK